MVHTNKKAKKTNDRSTIKSLAGAGAWARSHAPSLYITRTNQELNSSCNRSLGLFQNNQYVESKKICALKRAAPKVITIQTVKYYL